MSVPSYPQMNWRAAGTTSDPIELTGASAVGFFTPGVVAGATCTFLTSDKIDGTYVPVKNSSGAAIQFTVAANGYYGFTSDQIYAFLAARFLKIVSAASEAANSQWKLATRDIS